MHNFNILLFFLTIIFVIIIFLCNIYFSNIKLFYKYYFWFPIGCLLLIYFLLLRWIPDLNNLIVNLNKDISVQQHSILWSKVLLLDMCPLSYVLLSLSLIFDKTRTTTKILCPITIIGGSITMFSFLVNPPEDMWTINQVKYFFLGTETNRIYFMMHFLMVLFGLGLYLNTKTFTKYSFVGELLFLIFFIAYVQIIINSLNIQSNASGMVEGDWYQPNNINGYWFSQYGFVYNLIPIPFPWIVYFWYFIIFLLILLFLFIKNRFIKNKNKISQLGKYWYQKIQFCNKQFFLIDIWFNKIANKLPKWLRTNYLDIITD